MQGVPDPQFLDGSLISGKKVDDPLILTLNFEVNHIKHLIEYMEMAKRKGKSLIIMASYMKTEVINQLASYYKNKIYDVFYIEIPN